MEPVHFRQRDERWSFGRRVQLAAVNWVKLGRPCESVQKIVSKFAQHCAEFDAKFAEFDAKFAEFSAKFGAKFATQRQKLADGQAAEWCSFAARSPAFRAPKRASSGGHCTSGGAVSLAPGEQWARGAPEVVQLLETVARGGRAVFWLECSSVPANCSVFCNRNSPMKSIIITHRPPPLRHSAASPKGRPQSDTEKHATRGAKQPFFSPLLQHKLALFQAHPKVRLLRTDRPRPVRPLRRRVSALCAAVGESKRRFKITAVCSARHKSSCFVCGRFFGGESGKLELRAKLWLDKQKVCHCCASFVCAFLWHLN